MSAISPFERGWQKAIDLWRSGLTYEAIAARAEEEFAIGAETFSKGMRGAVDAMSGWLDSARRAAKAHGLSETATESLIERAFRA